MAATNNSNPDPNLLQKVFIHHLDRVYNGKCFLRENLDQLIDLVSFDGLRLAMGEFAHDVTSQINRMKTIYSLVNETPSDVIRNPIKSIVADKFFIDEQQVMPVINDLDVILYVQLLEHVNITSYRMLTMIAKSLKMDEVIQLLTENNDESKDNDVLFQLIAKEYITKGQKVA